MKQTCSRHGVYKSDCPACKEARAGYERDRRARGGAKPSPNKYGPSIAIDVVTFRRLVNADPRTPTEICRDARVDPAVYDRILERGRCKEVVADALACQLGTHPIAFSEWLPA